MEQNSNSNDFSDEEVDDPGANTYICNETEAVISYAAYFVAVAGFLAGAGYLAGACYLASTGNWASALDLASCSANIWTLTSSLILAVKRASLPSLEPSSVPQVQDSLTQDHHVEDSKECRICRDHSAWTAILPCLHFACCKCLSRPEMKEKCPFCRQEIVNLVDT